MASGKNETEIRFVTEHVVVDVDFTQSKKGVVSIFVFLAALSIGYNITELPKILTDVWEYDNINTPQDLT